MATGVAAPLALRAIPPAAGPGFAPVAIRQRGGGDQLGVLDCE